MRHLLFLNGQIHATSKLRAFMRADDIRIGVDGGAAAIAQLGLQPTAIIGDLDSIAPDLLATLMAQGVSVERHPVDKDQSDLELALAYVLRAKATEVVLVGAFGGRIDHTLGTLFLLTRPDLQGLALSLYDGETLAIVVRPGPAIEVHGNPGDTLSLVPLTPQAHGITLRGVRWPLHNETISQSSSRTLSNRFTDSCACIGIQEGLVLAVQGG